MWFLTLPRIKFTSLVNIKEGEILRIRSVTRDATSKRNMIVAKNLTNVLKFMPGMQIVRDLQALIQDQTDEDKIALEDPNEVIMSPVIFTEIIDGDKEDSPYRGSPLFKLQDLFLEYENIPDEYKRKNAFKVRFTTYRYDPREDTREVVQAMCPKCKATKSCAEMEGSEATCTDCGVACRLIYQVQFLVKDACSQLNKNFYRVLLYSYEDGKGDTFFGSKPDNLYQNHELAAKVESSLAKMTRFNVWCEAILERKNQFFVIKDTQIKFSA